MYVYVIRLNYLLILSGATHASRYRLQLSKYY